MMDKNENKSKDMQEILQYLNVHYVPAVTATNEYDEEETVIAQKIQFGGDHLTFERAVKVKEAVCDSDTKYECLEGILPKVEDFHCELNFLMVC